VSYSVLQCVAVIEDAKAAAERVCVCSALQCVAVCCNVLQFADTCCSVLQFAAL